MIMGLGAYFQKIDLLLNNILGKKIISPYKKYKLRKNNLNIIIFYFEIDLLSFWYIKFKYLIIFNERIIKNIYIINIYGKLNINLYIGL